jgi:2-isopropylmalate synthase
MDKIKLYDTTLRDGMQAEGVSFSLEDKLAIARCLDELGLDYIEGGYAASNPKEIQFFEEAAKLDLKKAKIAAFGNTRRADTGVSEDVSLNTMLACKTQVVTLVGKTWDMHVTQVLGCSLDDNLMICAESVEYLKKHGIETIFDAEHFFDGYKENPEYTMKVLVSAAQAGADAIVLCDTNGGCMPEQVYEITSAVCKQFGNIVVGIHTHNDTDRAQSMVLVSGAATQTCARSYLILFSRWVLKFSAPKKSRPSPKCPDMFLR